jgi:hypothetical protein
LEPGPKQKKVFSAWETLISFYYFANTEINFMDSIDTITSEIVKFRNEREWEQFHNSKDLALATSNSIISKESMVMIG